MTKKRSQNPPSPDLLTRLFRDVSLAMRLVIDRRVGGMTKLIPLLTMLYIISPIDLVPDFLLPFGIVDDLSAFVVGLQMFIHSAPPDVVKEYRTGKTRPAIHEEAPRSKTSNAPQIIEGEYEVRDDR